MSETITPTIISFVQIPYTWKVPGQYMEVKPALNENAVLPFPARGLVMGQMTSAGSATPGQKYELLAGNQANALFGPGSMAAEMAWSWLAANPYTPCDIIGIADASESVAATGSILIAGTATGAGTLAPELAGVRVPVAVNIGDTAAEIAANLYAALQLQGKGGLKPIPGLAASYTSDTATVDLTALNAGTLGNTLDIRMNAQAGDVTPAGLTVTITPMANGATDPAATIATALSGLASIWYTDVAFPWTDSTNVTAITAWAAERYGAMVNQDVQIYAALDASYGTALDFEPNSQYYSGLPVQNSRSPAWKIGAGLAGACCYSTAQKPSLQMRTVVLPGIVAPAPADLFSLNEREALLVAGLSTFTSDANDAFYLERVVTTYRNDPGEIPNNAWFDLAAVKVPTRVRYDWNNYIGQLYPRANLAANGSIAAQYDPDCVTPADLAAQWAGRSNVYEQNGWIQNSAVTAKNSTFVINATDGNRVDARMQIQIMGNLMVLAGSLEFISTN